MPRLIYVILASLSLSSPIEAQTRRSALPADESRNMIQLESGFDIHLLASEPLVVDPVEVAFDGAGRMWVVEMRDYPLRLGELASCKIKVLSDTTEDGVYDHATIFADELEMANGLEIWEDGVVVTLAGELVFLRDTDSDGVADERQQWLTGFAEDNEQLRANHPRLGPDGWLYIACGLRGGNVQLGSHFKGRSGKPLKIGSRDIRFDPSTGRLEPVTGPAQFGLCFDLLGSRVFCSNRNPAVQVVFEQSDLNGNPLAGLVPSTVDVLPAGVDSAVFPLVDAWTTSNLHAGQFTAACGVYLRNSVGYEEVFACEPTGSLVKRVELRRSRASLTPNSHPSPQREWLASRDPWFRPVNVTVAPNGQVVVVDMHRAVIEHPRWVPDELKNRPDERWGNSAGRIFEITRGNHTAFENVVRDLQESPLGGRTSTQLVELLASNQWYRTIVSRILLHRRDETIIPLLLERASDRNSSESARIESLRLAINLNAGLTEGFERMLRKDETESFLISSLRLVRAFNNNDPQLVEQLEALASQRGAIQFEALLCMANFAPQDAAPELVASIAATHDPHLLVAATSAFRKSPAAFLTQWLDALGDLDGDLSDSDAFIVSASERLAKAATSNPEARQEMLDRVVGLCNREISDTGKLACLSAIKTLLVAKGASGNKESTELAPKFWRQVRTIAQGTRQHTLLRRAAAEVLSRSPEVSDQVLLGTLARRAELPELTHAFLSAWAETGDTACDEHLVALLSSGSPRQKRAAITLIGQSAKRLALVASALDAQTLSARSIGAAELKQLQNRAQGDLKQVFAGAVGGLVNADRAKVVQDYKTALDIRGDASRGKVIFRQQCAACHKMGDIGVDVGPDISDSRTKKPIELLTSILNPNLAIDNNYFRFVVLTEDDHVLEGIIVEETADAIIIRGQDDKRDVILRDDIQQLKATGVSLMPDGLEAQINHQAMADLISYIKGWRYMDGSIPTR